MAKKGYDLMNRTQDLVHAAQNVPKAVERSALNLDRQVTQMRVDATEIISRTITPVSNSIVLTSQTISNSCNLITNIILGLGACIVLNLLLYGTELLSTSARFGIWNVLATSVRFGVWSVLAYLCYCIVKTYIKHSHWLEKPYSNKEDNHVRFYVIAKRTLIVIL